MAVNNKKRVICVKNLKIPEIKDKVSLLINTNGEAPKRFRESVRSETPAIRPIWNAFQFDSLNPFAKLRKFKEE